MTALPFHPAVARWFNASFAQPTDCQAQAWAAIARGEHTLIAAPTGSGKTLAAFLGAINELVVDGQSGGPRSHTRVVYVSPLKALSNDIQINLEQPLAGIRAQLCASGDIETVITTAVRTGDTPAAARAHMRRNPPDILVTTPESLYILLSSDSGRAMLAGTRTVIVDEIHALANSKRGSHLALSLARLETLVARPLQRIGLSATQRPIEAIARFLVGTRNCTPDQLPRCTIIDTGHVRQWDVAVELPGSPLAAVASAEQAAETCNRLASLIEQHRTTLIFVNTRRLAERIARALSERLGAEHVTSHHGSLAKDRRLDAERRLKAGTLKALVATASLELGIDIGDVDLVCQLGTTRSLAVFLQRVGRSGHGVGRIPKGRLFPQTRDELVESAALFDMMRRGELDRLQIPVAPLDVLAQQLVAELSCQEWDEQALFEMVGNATPYADLDIETFRNVVRMLADGFSMASGRRSAYLYRDAVNGRLRARPGARLTAVTCGGAIPDNADYDVILEPGGQLVGTVNEDFAIESLPGNIFQLGNASWRLLRVEQQSLRVADAHGQAPDIPFWLGEAPGRSDELSYAVARIRADFELRAGGSADPSAVADWLGRDIGIGADGARQLYDYLESARLMLGCLPTQQTLIIERFFDEAGGMQLVIHAPLGARLNRAFGLALRKRFCRRFNFELQAAATSDAIVISLGPVHSFELKEVWSFLHADSVRDVLIQALLDAPMFPIRWRWNATCALAIRRFRDGRKVPPQIQRMQAEDLIALVFPDQLACAENLTGKREVPDHPLVNQAIHDCLTEAMDIVGLEQLLTKLQAGELKLIERDLTEPSPLAAEVLNANPYAFLDDAPLEERRTRAVQSRRWLDPAQAAGIGQLDPGAIDRVRDEARPAPRSADELHDALLLSGFLTADEVRAAQRLPEATGDWQGWFDQLRACGRACEVVVGAGRRLWVATERVPEVVAALAPVAMQPRVQVPAEFANRQWHGEAALVALLRCRLEGLGPQSAAELAEQAGIPIAGIHAALLALENEGTVLRGRYCPDAGEQWCHRRLLARIHRYTLERLRREIEPVSMADYLQFLTQWQSLAPGTQRRAAQGVVEVATLLSGFEAAAAAWEPDLLASRVLDFESAWLDQCGAGGTVTWARLSASTGIRPTMLRSTPIALMPRNELRFWLRVCGSQRTEPSARAGRAFDFIRDHGAAFFDDLRDGTGLLTTELEDALSELVAAGLIHADSFAGLRTLITPDSRRPPRRNPRGALLPVTTGRWARLPDTDAAVTDTDYERLAHILLRRYGIVFRRLIDREPALPAWRHLVWALRRLEMAGEVRGGRFIAGVSGEQFALPDAIGAVRDIRKHDAAARLIVICACDPLNMSGILTPGARIPATAQQRIALQDGVPVAVQSGNDISFLADVDPETACRIRTAIIDRRPVRHARAG